MKYPMMPGNQSKRIDIPKLDGGVNLFDGVTQVQDNQLTDCLNMWWKDGMLRCRPGVNFTDVTIMDRAKIMDMQIISVSQTEKWILFIGLGNNQWTPEEFEMPYVVRIQRIRYVDGEIVVDQILEQLTMAEYGLKTAIAMPLNGVKTASGQDLLGIAFTSNGSIYGKYQAHLSFNENLAYDIYRPVVMVDSKPVTSVTTAALNGVPYEGYNLLNDSFDCTFTSDNNGIYYFLPQISITDSTLDIWYYLNNGNRYRATIDPGSNISSIGTSGYRVMVNWVGGYFYFVTESSTTPIKLPVSGIRENIQASIITSDSKKVIHKMKYSTWFGGDRSSQGGGNRLFVAGNPDSPNLIHWSAVNNPLYFPENNYAIVGDASNVVTGFAKQENKLIIFKEDEIYYATYTAGQTVTAEDIEAGRVVDVQTVQAVFPITQIHSVIGCDCPKTIQSCNNRLVWATKEKKVYMLTGTSQYSESNVLEISRNIEPALDAFTAEDFDKAVGMTYKGHYILKVRNTAFLFNYMDNRFVYYAMNNVYNRTDTNIPWYIWEYDAIGADLVGFLRFQDETFGFFQASKPMTAFPDINTNYWAFPQMTGKMDTQLTINENDSTTISQIPVSCMLQTKVYDFGAPERFKDMQQVYIATSNDNEYDIDLTYISDRGDYEDMQLIPVHALADSRSANHISVRRLTPGLRRILRFGIRLVSAGAIAIESLVLKFKWSGGNSR